jgi:hypothetical protein
MVDSTTVYFDVETADQLKREHQSRQDHPDGTALYVTVRELLSDHGVTGGETSDSEQEHTEDLE